MRAWAPFLMLQTLCVGLLSGQEVSGRIDGRVLGPDEAVLPDVEIIATSPSLLGTRAAITDGGGRFQLAGLPVGVYRVSARRIGFRPVVVQGVAVRLGETASLPRITLSAAVVELAEVMVTAEAAGLDPGSTASRIALDAGQLEDLPLSRDFREIALLAPSAIPSFLGRAGGVPDGINIGGATGIENSYYVDGINITDVDHGGAGLDLPYNFIDQIEIRTGGSTAEDAQALGGVINVVTPSGGERLRAGGFAFYSADELRTEPRTLLSSTETGFQSYDLGAKVSGPLLPRRLWFFAAYNRTSDRREQSYPFGPADNTERKHLFAGKVTWRAGPNTSAAFTIIGDPRRGEGIGSAVFASGARLDAEGAERKTSGGGIGVSVRASHFVTPHLVIEGGLAQLGRDQENLPATAAGRAPAVSDLLDGTISGGGGGSSRGESRRRSGGVTLSWRAGSHALRGGVLYEQLRVEGSFDTSRPEGGNIIRADTNVWLWHSNRSQGGAAENRSPSAFLQDAWQVSPRLLLHAGLRWSRQAIHNLTLDTLSVRIRDGLQPRLGVVFQPGPIGTQRVYASYGRVANQATLRGVVEQYGFGAETLFVFQQDPRLDTARAGVQYTIQNGIGFYGDGTIRGETADEFAVGYDRKLTRSLALSVRAVRRAHRDAVQIGLDTLDGLVMGNPGRGALARFPRQRRTYNALELVLERTPGPRSPWVRLSYVLSRTHGNYPGLYGSDWSLDFGHVGPLYFTPAQHQNGTGFLPNDRRHVLKLFGAQPVGSRFTLGASFLLASGTPRSEYGAIPRFGPPFRGFASQRGTAGRTPTLWDLGLRASYQLPSPWGPNTWSRVLLDLEHVGSPRTAVDYDQVHFTCLDAAGNQSCPNAGYGRVIQYQPPMTVRLGIEAGF